MKIDIRKLEKRDERSEFSSGDIEIDRFFLKFAGQNQFKHKIGVTYVAVEHSSQKILGYATVSSGSLKVRELTEAEFYKFPNYPLPILRIARLGVDKRYQGKGIGKELLKYMLYLAMDIEDKVGCIGIFVDAKADAVAFYQRYGFKPVSVIDGELPARPLQQIMYLSIKKIHKILG